MPAKKSTQKETAVIETTGKKEKQSPKSLHRSNTNKVIAGVAGGIGEYFDLDPTIIRLIFVLLTVFGGSGILIYLILWLIMPSSEYTTNSDDNLIKQNLDEMSDRAKSIAHDLRINNPKDSNNSKFWWGFLIIIFGIILLFQNLGIFDLINFQKFWPTLLILLGIILLLKKK